MSMAYQPNRAATGRRAAPRLNDDAPAPHDLLYGHARRSKAPGRRAPARARWPRVVRAAHRPRRPRRSHARAASRSRPLHRPLVAHYRHHADRSKPGKPKGACPGLGQINAAAFNVRSSVRNRDRDGMSGLLVGYLHRGTKGQRFVRRGHGVIVERDAAGSCGSRLRRISHAILDATHSSPRAEMLTKQSTSAAINRRMLALRFI